MNINKALENLLKNKTICKKNSPQITFHRVGPIVVISNLSDENYCFEDKISLETFIDVYDGEIFESI